MKEDHSPGQQDQVVSAFKPSRKQHAPVDWLRTSATAVVNLVSGACDYIPRCLVSMLTAMAENGVTGVRNAYHAEQDSGCRLRTNRIRISGGMLRLDAGPNVIRCVN